ncbi:CBF-domain-containing protein [Hortaea werneckii]|nr:CBF-domain-containing protein [Hortaea werneckii]
MPGVLTNGDASHKRKRDDAPPKTSTGKSRKAPKTVAAKSEDGQTKILSLEEQILQGRKHYNNIVELQSHVNLCEKKPKTGTLAAVALCRVFCRLIASEELVKGNDQSDADGQVAQWLKARLREYVEVLAGSWIGSPDAAQESTALTLLMRLVKEETNQGAKRSEQAWKTERSTFFTLVSALLEKKDAEGARQEFVGKYVEEHDDVRFYTFVAVRQYFKLRDVSGMEEQLASNAIDILGEIEGIPDSEDQIEDWYGEPPEGKKHQLLSLHTHRKTAQEAWLSIFRLPLDRANRKRILHIATTRILPWFTTRMELLTDFLTDSFSAGDTLSLLALSSIFHLMTTHNLDYPDFYTKLYSLVSGEILHSKHRSRFFRELERFLSSTHLPASIIASFLKRLARLALHAPPGAIVWIIPWTYNMLRAHPACTFLLHRPYHPTHTLYTLANPEWRDQGMRNDTFTPSEPDPNHTGAISSSLWELETLQAHYHPNVATLAKILSEPFTKREYTLEDFLDHSYGSLLEGELDGREVRKEPVVEWEIPKRIVTAGEDDGKGEGGGGGDGLNRLGGLLERAIVAQQSS